MDNLELRRGEVTDGRLTVPYRVYVPLGFSYTRPWPVILYLHGFGERGEDGEAPLRAGIGPILRQYPECFPCLIVIPQAPRSRVRWEGDVNELALKALEAVVQRYRGDRHRLYLTGVSMGGAGCWRIVAKYPRRFAAVMPICGRSDPRAMAPKLARLPIWVFHGARDRIVPVQFSREMVKALRAVDNARVHYTEYARSRPQRVGPRVQRSYHYSLALEAEAVSKVTEQPSLFELTAGSATAGPRVV